MSSYSSAMTRTSDQTKANAGLWTPTQLERSDVGAIEPAGLYRPTPMEMYLLEKAAEDIPKQIGTARSGRPRDFQQYYGPAGGQEKASTRVERAYHTSTPTAATPRRPSFELQPKKLKKEPSKNDIIDLSDERAAVVVLNTISHQKPKQQSAASEIVDLSSDDGKSHHRRNKRCRVRPVDNEYSPSTLTTQRYKTDPNERRIDPTPPTISLLPTANMSHASVQNHAIIEIQDADERGTAIDLVDDALLPTPWEVPQIVEVRNRPAAAPYMQVLEVFPDADINHVKHLLAELANRVEAVTSNMAELGYPKSEAPIETVLSISTPATTGAVLQRSDKEYKYDYLSTESFVATLQYMSDVRHILSAEFPFLTSHGVRACMFKHKSHYAVCHDKIIASLRGSSVKSASQSSEEKQTLQYESVMSALAGKPLTQAQKEGLEHLCGHKMSCRKGHQPPKPTPAPTDPILAEEYAFVQHRFQEWKASVEKHIKRKRNKELAQRNGTAVECSCCFDSFALEDMIPCRNEGHLFCVDCLKAFAENQIFGTGNLGVDKSTKQSALELKCMHGDGCASGFAPESLEKSLPVKTLRKYYEMQFQVVIERAGISNDMCTCPKCGYQAALPESEKIFACPVSICRFKSCRACGEAAHIPLRCDEVEKERETKGRLTVEEAISAAKIRTCPKCKKGFVKSDGCNKIVCGCGALICYVCRQMIKGYDHFCRTPHCNHKSCGECLLYTNAEQDDFRAMREAGFKAAAEVKADLAKIDVEKMLKT